MIITIELLVFTFFFSSVNINAISPSSILKKPQKDCGYDVVDTPFSAMTLTKKKINPFKERPSIHSEIGYDEVDSPFFRRKKKVVFDEVDTPKLDVFAKAREWVDEDKKVKQERSAIKEEIGCDEVDTHIFRNMSFHADEKKTYKFYIFKSVLLIFTKTALFTATIHGFFKFSETLYGFLFIFGIILIVSTIIILVYFYKRKQKIGQGVQLRGFFHEKILAETLGDFVDGRASTRTVKKYFVSKKILIVSTIALLCTTVIFFFASFFLSHYGTILIFYLIGGFLGLLLLIQIIFTTYILYKYHFAFSQRIYSYLIPAEKGLKTPVKPKRRFSSAQDTLPKIDEVDGKTNEQKAKKSHERLYMAPTPNEQAEIIGRMQEFQKIKKEKEIDDRLKKEKEKQDALQKDLIFLKKQLQKAENQNKEQGDKIKKRKKKLKLKIQKDLSSNERLNPLKKVFPKSPSNPNINLNADFSNEKQRAISFSDVVHVRELGSSPEGSPASSEEDLFMMIGDLNVPTNSPLPLIRMAEKVQAGTYLNVLNFEQFLIENDLVSQTGLYSKMGLQYKKLITDLYQKIADNCHLSLKKFKANRDYFVFLKDSEGNEEASCGVLDIEVIFELFDLDCKPLKKIKNLIWKSLSVRYYRNFQLDKKILNFDILINFILFFSQDKVLNFCDHLKENYPKENAAIILEGLLFYISENRFIFDNCILNNKKLGVFKQIQNSSETNEKHKRFCETLDNNFSDLVRICS